MNIDAANAAHESLVKSGVNFVACLPDSAFQEYIYLFRGTRRSPTFRWRVRMTVSESAWALGWVE